MRYTFTFQDAVEHLVDFVGGNPSEVVQRDARRCILSALRDLTCAHQWSYLTRHGRIFTNAPYDGADTAATIAYDHTGGAMERMMTLTDGVWPSWAAGGFVRASSAQDSPSPGDLGLVAYRVDRRISDTVLTLEEEVNPGADIASGTFFKLYQDTYLLPPDFLAGDQSFYERNFGGMHYVHPREWLFENRYIFAEGVPRQFTITGDPQYPGRQTMRLMPFPSETKSVDFVYLRTPRPLSLVVEQRGRVAVTMDSPVVTGTGTAFTTAMIGCVFRLSGQAAKAPSTPIGDNPPILESRVIDVASASALTLSDPAPAGYGGMPYSLSDPIDVENGAMLTAYMRGMEAQMATARSLKEKLAILGLYNSALELARAADSRSMMGRSEGSFSHFTERLIDMPIKYALE